MPSVDSLEEAHELVAGQDANDNLDLSEMPFDHTYESAAQTDERQKDEGDRKAGTPD